MKPVEEVLESLGITPQTYTSHTQEFICLCPFHDDHKPSFSINEDTGLWQCWSCQESGNLEQLVARKKNITIAQARKELEEPSGLFRADEVILLKARLERAKKRMVGRFPNPVVYGELEKLCGGVDEETVTYLKGRGFTEDTIKRFRIFSVGNYQAVNELLKEFPIQSLQRAGLCNENDNLIFYRHKLIFPFISDEKVVYLQGRCLDSSHPKYLNLGVEIPLYNRDGLKKLKEGDRVYVCEGVMDALTIEQCGRNAVGVLGANNFKTPWVRAFHGMDVMLVFDNDRTGKKATELLTKMFLDYGITVRSKNVPEKYNDINQAYLALGNVAFLD